MLGLILDFMNSTPNVTSVSDFFNLASASTGGWLFYLITLAVWFILFLSLNSFPTVDAMVASTLITLIISVILWAAGLVGFNLVLLLTVAFVSLAIIMVKRNS